MIRTKTRKLRPCVLRRLKEPPPKKGLKRTTDGPISKIVDRLKGEKAPYWFCEYLRCNMGLTDSCREAVMRIFDEASRVDMEESTRCPDTLEVRNKWLIKLVSCHDNAARQFRDLGLDINECLDGFIINGVDEVEKL